jgi:hypothetical protein
MEMRCLGRCCLLNELLWVVSSWCLLVSAFSKLVGMVYLFFEALIMYPILMKLLFHQNLTKNGLFSTTRT